MGFRGAIFDIDGVLVATPHERAWRETLGWLFENEWREEISRTRYQPEAFTPEVYQEQLSGKPRLEGAVATLRYFAVPDAEQRALRYAEVKQALVIDLIEKGEFTAFDDGLRFILEVKASGIYAAAASSSKNAHLFLRQIDVDTFSRAAGKTYDFVKSGTILMDLFDADVSGRDFAQGKPHPEIFETAAAELGFTPDVCFVVEDAVAGIQAAKAARMAALGVARLDDAGSLKEAGADEIVTTLDEVSITALSAGRLAKYAEE